MKIVVFFSGTGTNLKSILDHQGEYGYEVCFCFTNNPEAEGLVFCEEYSVNCKIIDHKDFDDRQEYDGLVNSFLESVSPDLIVLAGYMRIMSKSLVENWEGQIVNIHPSLLPKYPGLHTHEKALEAKDKFHGSTIHYVTSELDAGPIIRQETFEIEPSDTTVSLTKKVKKLEHKIYPETISLLLKQ